jgi:hypothetical protein
VRVIQVEAIQVGPSKVGPSKVGPSKVENIKGTISSNRMITKRNTNGEVGTSVDVKEKKLL